MASKLAASRLRPRRGPAGAVRWRLADQLCQLTDAHAARELTDAHAARERADQAEAAHQTAVQLRAEVERLAPGSPLGTVVITL